MLAGANSQDPEYKAVREYVPFDQQHYSPRPTCVARIDKFKPVRDYKPTREKRIQQHILRIEMEQLQCQESV